MYAKSAAYYDALYAFMDYEAAVRSLLKFVDQHAPGAASLLDVACGTGQHLAHLHGRFAAEGLDINADLLAIARDRCQGVTFHKADMAQFDLERRFDVVTCLFSSVAYVRTRARLDAAIAAMARHVAPGGLLLVEPWFTPESFWDGHLASNYTEQPGLAISWMYIGRKRGRISELDIHYQVGTPEGIHRFNEIHALGLFTAAEYEGAFRAAGLDPRYDEKGFFGRGLYWAQAPR